VERTSESFEESLYQHVVIKRFTGSPSKLNLGVWEIEKTRACRATNRRIAVLYAGDDYCILKLQLLSLSPLSFHGGLFNVTGNETILYSRREEGLLPFNFPYVAQLPDSLDPAQVSSKRLRALVILILYVDPEKSQRKALASCVL
jgi:hypothetical protein